MNEIILKGNIGTISERTLDEIPEGFRRRKPQRSS